MFRRWAIFGCAIVLLASVSGVSADGITVQGTVDCGRWVESRKHNRGEILQAYLTGLLNGMALGSGIEFWNARGYVITREQVYLWMDNYCQKNPLSGAIAGAVELMNEQTDNAWSRYKKLRQ